MREPQKVELAKGKFRAFFVPLLDDKTNYTNYKHNEETIIIAAFNSSANDSFCSRDAPMGTAKASPSQ